jgi:hypothetical protein
LNRVRYGQVALPLLQYTPPAQLFGPPPGQDTWHIEALQVTVRAQESLPEQRIVLEAAEALTPAAQERFPLQVISHWLPPQLMAARQASAPEHVTCVLEAALETPPAQPPGPAQVTVH